MVEQQANTNSSLADRWAELSRKLELELEVQELDETGEYTAVEVTPSQECGAGGVVQMRQGQQRRVCARVRPVPGSGTLPVILTAITSIAVRSRLQSWLFAISGI